MAALSDRDHSPSTLSHLRTNPSDHEAWRAFVSVYGRVIRQWCRRWGLQPADAEDVTQEVLIAVARQLPQLSDEPTRSFAAFLRLITYRSRCRLLSRRRRSDAHVAHDDQTADAHGLDFLEHLARDAERELLGRAIDRVRRRVSPRTWEAFRQTAFEDRSGIEVAERLRINVATVFVGVSRVRKLLREEIRRLDPPG